MTKINLGRVILGGIVAGIIINVVEDVLQGPILGGQWNQVMRSLNRPDLNTNQIIAFNVLGFLTGLVAVWTYAAIRPRFGAGPKTAVIAGVLTWVGAFFMVYAFPVVMGIFPISLSVICLAVGFVEMIVATIVGAWLYKEAA